MSTPYAIAEALLPEVGSGTLLKNEWGMVTSPAQGSGIWPQGQGSLEPHRACYPLINNAKQAREMAKSTKSSGSGALSIGNPLQPRRRQRLPRVPEKLTFLFNNGNSSCHWDIELHRPERPGQRTP
jgi:hypothetical protein